MYIRTKGKGGRLPVPEPIEFGDKIVGLIEYRDGTIIDVIRQVK